MCPSKRRGTGNPCHPPEGLAPPLTVLRGAQRAALAPHAGARLSTLCREPPAASPPPPDLPEASSTRGAAPLASMIQACTGEVGPLDGAPALVTAGHVAAGGLAPQRAAGLCGRGKGGGRRSRSAWAVSVLRAGGLRSPPPALPQARRPGRGRRLRSADPRFSLAPGPLVTGLFRLRDRLVLGLNAGRLCRCGHWRR